MSSFFFVFYKSEIFKLNNLTISGKDLKINKVLFLVVTEAKKEICKETSRPSLAK